jgi:hypothetical protein
MIYFFALIDFLIENSFLQKNVTEKPSKIEIFKISCPCSCSRYEKKNIYNFFTAILFLRWTNFRIFI